MSRQSLTAVVTTILGATLGGLLVWRVFWAPRKRLPLNQKRVAEPVEPPRPAAPEVTEAVESQSPSALPQLPPPALLLPSAKQLLEVTPVMVSSEDEWHQLWPSLQEELSVYPVLGLDCEWVSVKGKTSAVSLLQMSSYSGLCVLVRLQSFRNGQQSFPLSLMEVLRDPHILKVGVGCFEDGKRLTRDYGLSLGCTVDLRYLALRQKYT